MRFLVLFLLLFSCSNPPPKVREFSGIAMTIPYKILVVDGDEKKVKEIISATFLEIDTLYNKWNPTSELSKLNQLKAYDKAPLSPKLEQFLQFVEQIVILTDNRFDPTIEPLQQLWKKYLAFNKEPSQEEIEKIIPALGWQHIHFDKGFFYKDHDLTSLDLGGIAKGYAVDLLVENLNNAGFKDVFVEWGGEIKTSGKHPENRPWTIFISRLENTDPTQAIATLPLNNQAIATSGDYLQNWQVNGTTYFHVIDPKTYRPLKITKESIASASVLANTCAFADGIATACLFFPNLEEAKVFATSIQTKYPDVQFWLLSR